MAPTAAKQRTRKAAPRKGTSINLRINEATRDMIDSAAAAVGKSRTEFMLESARAQAMDVLLDQRMFVLGDRQFSDFVAALDRSPRSNPALKKLLASKAPWER